MYSRPALALVLALLVALVAGCRATASTPTPAPQASQTSGAASSIVVAVATPSPSPTASPTKQPSPTPRPSPTPAPSAVPTAAPKPTTAAVAPGPIAVALPAANQEVTSPLRIFGRAQVFEAQVDFDLVADGRSLGKGHAMAAMGAPEWATFDTLFAFQAPPQPTNAVLRVYATSMKDGSPVGLVEIPVRLRPGASAGTSLPLTPVAGTHRLTLFYPWSTANDVVLVATRRDVPSTPAIGRATIEELLRGPTAEEQALGLYSPFPSGTRLNSLKIVDGTAYADFDQGIEQGMGGSTRVMTVRRSIEQTLRQFSTVQKVVISVDGKTEGVLQP